MRYASALALSFGVISDEARDIAFSVDVTQPSISFDAEVTDHVSITSGATSTPVATGDAIELLEAVSRRVPYSSDTPESIQRAFDGLGRVFDQITD